jgi:succinylarginine dihydrolase
VDVNLHRRKALQLTNGCQGLLVILLKVPQSNVTVKDGLGMYLMLLVKRNTLFALIMNGEEKELPSTALKVEHIIASQEEMEDMLVDSSILWTIKGVNFHGYVP